MTKYDQMKVSAAPAALDGDKPMQTANNPLPRVKADDPDLMTWSDVKDCGLGPVPADADDGED